MKFINVKKGERFTINKTISMAVLIARNGFCRLGIIAAPPTTEITIGEEQTEDIENIAKTGEEGENK